MTAGDIFWQTVMTAEGHLTGGKGLAVAVSGGADSLAALLYLKRAGFELLALHGLFFSHADAEREREAQKRREELAGLCRDLGAPLHMVDLRADFARLVVRPFVEAYALGLTPNPCAMCNAAIKFGLLLEAALSLGASGLATGHYARLEPRPEGESWPALYQGADQSRDQSYFLCLVPGPALARAFFPLADRPKSEVLRDLDQAGLSPPQPGESREICFIEADSYQDILPALAAAHGIKLPGPGPMLLADGRRLGRHQGLWRYTEGQRRGLGLGWTEPLYVLGKEAAANALRLGPRREMRAGGCRCAALNLLVPPKDWPQTVLVKSRYREKPKEARVLLETGQDGAARLRIIFADQDFALAPGQAAALHAPGALGPERLRLLGGGIIESVE